MSREPGELIGDTDEEDSCQDDEEMFLLEEPERKEARRRRRQKKRDAVIQGYVSIATYNVQTGQNLRAAIRVAKRAGIGILLVQEQKGRAIKGKLWGKGEWRQWSSGADSQGRAGVAFLVDERMSNRINILDVSFPSPRLGIMKASIDGRPTTLVNMYAKFQKVDGKSGEQVHGEAGDEWLKEKDDSDDVFELALEHLRDVPQEEIFVGGDLNTHISYEDWLENGHICNLDESEIKFMSEKTNSNGAKTLDFCNALNLKLVNLTTQTKWDKVCTYHGFERKVKTLIDYIAIPVSMDLRSHNCATIDAYGVGSDHKVVACKYWVADRAQKNDSKGPRSKGTKLPPETVIERKLRVLMRTAVPRPWYHPEEAVWGSLDTELAVMRLNAHRGRDKEKVRELKREVTRLRRRDLRLKMDIRAEEINRTRIRRGMTAVMKLISPMSFKRKRKSTFCLSRKERVQVHTFFEELYTKKELPEFKEWDVPDHPPKPPVDSGPTSPWVHWHVASDHVNSRIAAVRMEDGKAIEVHQRNVEARTEHEAETLAILWAIQLSPKGTKVRIYTTGNREATTFRQLTHNRAQDFANCEPPILWENVYCEALERILDITLAKEAPNWPKGTRIAIEVVAGKGNEVPKLEVHSQSEVNEARALGPRAEKTLRAHFAACEEAPTYGEVEDAIKRLRKGSTPGADGVHTDAIIQVEVQELVDILRTVWATKQIPTLWKRGIQIQIPKQGAGKDITDRLRGITLTSNLSKILTSIMYYRACAMDLDDTLFGFRPGRGTDTPVLIVKKAIRDAVRMKKRRFILFVDYTRMYDTLSREAMWPLLEKFGFGKTNVELLKKLYEDELLIEVGQGDRRPIKPTRGVRQGCLLSPLIANIAICAAFRATQEAMKGISLDEVILKMISYADDVVLFADSEEELALAWTALEKATRALGMTVNVKKTKLMEVISGTKRMRTTAEGYRSWQKQSGHFREEVEDVLETPKLQWDKNFNHTELCCQAVNLPLRCPECSGDCMCEFYPEENQGIENFVYSTSYRLAKHIKEVHLKDLRVRGQIMTGKSCLVRSMDDFDATRSIRLLDPRKKGVPLKSKVLGEGREIDRCENFKYLGVMLTNDGNFNEECSHRIRESWKAFVALRPLLRARRLRRSTKVAVWKTYVMSSLLSGAATWAPSHEQIEAVEKTMQAQLRSVLLEKKYTTATGETRTPSRERIRQLATIAPLHEILRERRLHARRTIMTMKSSLSKTVLVETWWSGASNPTVPVQMVPEEDDRELLVQHFLETAVETARVPLNKEKTERLMNFCRKYVSNKEVSCLVAMAYEGNVDFNRSIRALLEKERVQRVTRPDWGLLTKLDMATCGLIETDAEVRSLWEKKCEAATGITYIPYIEAPSSEEIEDLKSFKVAWTDGALSDETNVAGFAVVEGRWFANKHRLKATTCDYNAVVGHHTNNRGELSAVLKALQRGRRESLMLVIDSEMAIRSCLGCIIKNNEDLCDMISQEVRARTHPLALVKVWSHPLKKKKVATLLNIGNEMVDALAKHATKIPASDRPEKKCEIFRKCPREVAKERRGTVSCYMGEVISTTIKTLKEFTAQEVITALGDRGRPK